MTKKIMIIDDNIDMLETLKDVLTKRGYSVKIFDNNDEALGYFTTYSNEISLVCQDIIRPRGKCLKHLATNTNKIGIVFLTECLRRIKPEIPCLFQTSFALDNLPELKSMLNAFYIKKPYELDELVAAIEHALSKSQKFRTSLRTRKNVREMTLRPKSDVQDQPSAGKIIPESNTSLRVVSILILLIGILNLPYAYYVILKVVYICGFFNFNSTFLLV